MGEREGKGAQCQLTRGPGLAVAQGGGKGGDGVCWAGLGWRRRRTGRRAGLRAGVSRPVFARRSGQGRVRRRLWVQEQVRIVSL